MKFLLKLYNFRKEVNQFHHMLQIRTCVQLTVPTREFLPFFPPLCFSSGFCLCQFSKVSTMAFVGCTKFTIMRKIFCRFGPQKLHFLPLHTIRSGFKYKFSFPANKFARILTILLKVLLFSRDVLIAAIKISDLPSHYESDSFDVFSFQTINSHAVLNSADSIIQRVFNSIHTHEELIKF